MYSNFTLELDLFNSWAQPLNFQIGDIVHVSEKKSGLSFLPSKNVKAKKDLEMLLFLHAQIKEAVVLFPKKPLKQKICLFLSLRHVLPLFTDNNMEEKLEPVVQDLRGWLDEVTATISNVLQSGITLLEGEMKKIRDNTQLIKSSSAPPITCLTPFMAEDGCINMDAYLAAFGQQMKCNFANLNLIEGCTFRTTLGKLEKDVKLFFSPQFYSEHIVTKKKLQQCLDLYKNLEDFKNLFLEFAVEIREHWFYCKDELEVFHLENFDAKTISVAQYMSKHEVELAQAFDASASEKYLANPSAFPLSVPGIQELSEVPIVVKNYDEYLRVKEVYDLCLSVFEDYEHNLPTKSNFSSLNSESSGNTSENTLTEAQDTKGEKTNTSPDSNLAERSPVASVEGEVVNIQDANGDREGSAGEGKLAMLFDSIVVDGNRSHRSSVSMKDNEQKQQEQGEVAIPVAPTGETGAELAATGSERDLSSSGKLAALKVSNSDGAIVPKLSREKRKSDSSQKQRDKREVLGNDRRGETSTGSESHSGAPTTVISPSPDKNEKERPKEKKHKNKDKRLDSAPTPLDRGDQPISKKERRISSDPPYASSVSHTHSGSSTSSSALSSPTNSSAMLDPLHAEFLGEDGKPSPRHLPAHKSSRRKASGPGGRFSLLGSSSGGEVPPLSKEDAEAADQQQQISPMAKSRSGKKHERPSSKPHEKPVIEVHDPSLSPRGTHTLSAVSPSSSSASITPQSSGILMSMSSDGLVPTITLQPATPTGTSSSNNSSSLNSPTAVTLSGSGTCPTKRALDFQTKRPRRKDCRLDANGCEIYPLVLPNLSTHDLKPVLVVREIDDFVALMIAYNRYLFGLQDLSNSWNLTVRRLFEFFDTCKMFKGDADNFYTVSKLPRHTPKPLRHSKTFDHSRLKTRTSATVSAASVHLVASAGNLTDGVTIHNNHVTLREPSTPEKADKSEKTEKDMKKVRGSLVSSAGSNHGRIFSLGEFRGDKDREHADGTPSPNEKEWEGEPIIVGTFASSAGVKSSQVKRRSLKGKSLSQNKDNKDGGRRSPVIESTSNQSSPSSSTGHVPSITILLQFSALDHPEEIVVPTNIASIIDLSIYLEKKVESMHRDDSAHQSSASHSLKPPEGPNPDHSNTDPNTDSNPPECTITTIDDTTSSVSKVSSSETFVEHLGLQPSSTPAKKVGKHLTTSGNWTEKKFTLFNTKEKEKEKEREKAERAKSPIKSPRASLNITSLLLSTGDNAAKDQGSGFSPPSSPKREKASMMGQSNPQLISATAVGGVANSSLSSSASPTPSGHLMHPGARLSGKEKDRDKIEREREKYEREKEKEREKLDSKHSKAREKFFAADIDSSDSSSSSSSSPIPFHKSGRRQVSLPPSRPKPSSRRSSQDKGISFNDLEFWDESSAEWSKLNDVNMLKKHMRLRFTKS